MKQFKDVKIVGCVMIHNSPYAKRVLDDLAKYTNNIYVNLNDPSEENRNMVYKYDKVKLVILETTNKLNNWHQASQRGLTIRMLDDIKPDIILFPDDDELYPNCLMELLNDFWESDKKAFYFTMDYCYNDEQSIRKDGIFSRMHHVRAFKWEPGITYKPYPGKACPRTVFGNSLAFYDRKRAFVKHLGYMTERDRQIKYKRDGKKHYLETPKILITKNG